ncbi:ABC transporter permease [Rhodobacteraceae bacterium CCMM004]|nr:ABC transporter permease [Rhodobacteraceae bacterium CCMM004]
MRAARLARTLLPYAGLIGLIVYFSLASDFFLNQRNFERLITDSATLIVVSLGMTLVILLGEIDLSVGAVVALLSVLLAQMLGLGWPWPVAVLGALALGLLVGAINGALTVIGDIPSFIVTLGTSAIATGLAFIFTGAISVPIYDVVFLDLFYSDTILGLTVPLLLCIVAFAGTLLALTRTAWGRELTAIGANAAAARIAGVPVRRDKVLVFVAMGGLVAVGAILSAARLGSGAPGAAPSLTLDAIAAVIIGGASLFGGQASLVRTLLGALLIAVLNNGMVLLNINVDAQYVVKGVIILLAVVLERLGGGR